MNENLVKLSLRLPVALIQKKKKISIDSRWGQSLKNRRKYRSPLLSMEFLVQDPQ